MNLSQQNYLYRQFFRLRIHESMGESFQALFSRIMSYENPGFQSVAPWGNWGDGGNDGWIESESHYFQVYGPKPTASVREVDAVNKAVGDFDKLVAKWGSVQKYTFVMNDHFIGIPAPIGASLKKLKEERKLIHTGAMGGMELLQKFMTLPEDIRQDIVGCIPDATPDFIDARAVGELLNFLTGKSASSITFLCETAPDFDRKIEFNGISRPIRARLEANSYQVHVVNEFLDAREGGLQQTIAKEVRETYAQSKLAIPDSMADWADLRYLWMVDKLIPPLVHERPHSMAAFRFAAELVLAKYFETCDAYEHPDNAPAA